MEVLSGSPSLKLVTHKSTGEIWSDYRDSLSARYVYVWMDMAFIALMVIAGVVLMAITQYPYDYTAIPFIAMWQGFWLHAYITFFHEAAHMNIAPSRKLNDRLATLLLTPFCALDIGLYRKSHWQHHLNLGLLGDSEISYRSPLTARNIFFTLSGINVAITFLRYFRAHNLQSSSEEKLIGKKNAPPFRALGIFALTQFFIISLLVFLVSFPAAIAWVLGLVIVYPFFNWLRQILEHRSTFAQSDIDYAQVAHGPINRLFKTGFWSRYFGAAGFNRHLLHHWDPKISYSRFDDMERFLLQTSVAEQLNASRTTYGQTLRALLR